jgi:phosphoribosyl 1,2-cyclic phosphodiesterase
LKVRFWGTRGSIAKPGPTTARYGGNTSCIEVRSAAGTLLVIDCGTGAHGLGQALVADGVSRGCLLIGHTHWDHIQGIPFFAPLFAPNNAWDVCGPKGLSGSLRETLAGQMESTYFPVSLEELGATIRYWDLLEGTFRVDDIQVTTRHLNHPALTLAYKIQVDGATLVYACDHEMFSRATAEGNVRLDGADLRHAEFASGADLLVHDAQYTAVEYPKKVNWGHSTYEYALAVAREAGVRQLALTHHDPLRDDDQIDDMLVRARATMREHGSAIDVIAASEGLTIDLTPATSAWPPPPASTAPVKASVEMTDRVHTVVLAVRDPALVAVFEGALARDASTRVIRVNGIDEMRAAIEQRPSVAFLEHGPDSDALAICRALASGLTGDRRRPPIVVVADREHPGGAELGISEWLLAPFSSAYVQAKVRSWIFRRASHWMKAAIPADEEQRLATLQSLMPLDLPYDPRFDGIVRVASRFFEVPIAAVTLVGRDRQWFKSCVGLHMTDTSREAAFCAHTVFERTTLVVNDALTDDRFAENPLVIEQPRIRFYAGAPLIVSDGSALGSLCLIDTRPRLFSASDVQLLEDLRDLVVSELENQPQAAASSPARS